VSPGIDENIELAEDVDVGDGEVGFKRGEITVEKFFSARSVLPLMAARATLKPICAAIGSPKKPVLPPCPKVGNPGYVCPVWGYEGAP